MGKFNLVVFHSHLGDMQMTAQSSVEKQSEESGRGKPGLRCQVELLIYFSPYQSASWDIT